MNVGVALGLAVLLLALNAFFVAAEFAVTSSRRSAIEPLAKEGVRGAKQALHALEHVSLMLATSQLGITVMSTSLGVIAEPAIAGLIDDPLIALGFSPYLVHVVSFVLALVIVLYLHVVFGEMVPKNLSIARSTKTLLVLAPALVGLARLLAPLVRFLDALANWFIRRGGLEPKSEIAAAFTADEVAEIVEVSSREGALEDDLGLLAGTLGFGDESASHLMVPLEQVVSLPEPVSARDVEDMVAKTRFSRFPVTDLGGLPIGYIHLKDALHADEDALDQPLEPWRTRDLPRLPVSAKMDDALQRMQADATHLALVEDEDGDPLGIVFLEDLIEELVGQVRDGSQRDPRLGKGGG